VRRKERMYQWRKGIASWTCGNRLYLSVPFTWLLEEAQATADAHKGPVVCGGPAIKLMGPLSGAKAHDTADFDVLSMHNPCATFTTRGCPNKCAFCAVPKIEGAFVELETWKHAPVLCDNNLLECSRSHFSKVIESLKPFPACDFNQGLDARRFTQWHAETIAHLRHPKVRFAFDHANEESVVANAVETARKAGLRDFGIYVLFGFKDTLEDALYRLEKVREWGILPNAMRYQPLDAMKKNAYVEAGWEERDLQRVHRYYNKLNWLGHIPFDEYDIPDEPLFCARHGVDV